MHLYWNPIGPLLGIYWAPSTGPPLWLDVITSAFSAIIILLATTNLTLAIATSAAARFARQAFRYLKRKLIFHR